MRPGGKDGKLYRIQYGETIPGGDSITITKNGFYKVVSKAEINSGFPVANPSLTGTKTLEPGHVYYAFEDQPLHAGDAVKPMTLKMISFVTDVQDNAQGQSHDVTTQADTDSGIRSYSPGAFKERTGSINGVVDVDSEEQYELFNEYREIIYQDSTHVSVSAAKSIEHEYMMSRRETTETGETEMWEYMPLISESINTAKPMDGVQSFSINYRVDGQRKPVLISREVA